MSRFVSPVFNITDSNGAPMVGAKLVFYATGTATPKTIYSDAGLTTPITNPVTAVSSDAGAIYPDIYLDGVYKVVQQDDSGTADTDDGAVLWTRDPVGDVAAGNFSAWLSDTAYDEPEVVYASDDNYYYSLVDANQGNEPSVSPSQWQLIPMKDMASRKQILDDNGNEIMIFTTTATAVNEITVANAASGNNPTIEPSGESDIDLDLVRTGGTAAISAMKLETVANTTSGTTVPFTGIPSWAKKITIMFDGVSTDGASYGALTIGDSGGLETTGYSAIQVERTVNATSTTYFPLLYISSSALEFNGSVILTLLDQSTNTWIIHGSIYTGGTILYSQAGSKSLSGTLTQLQVATTTAVAFDGGKANLLIEG